MLFGHSNNYNWIGVVLRLNIKLNLFENISSSSHMLVNHPEKRNKTRIGSGLLGKNSKTTESEVKVRIILTIRSSVSCFLIYLFFLLFFKFCQLFNEITWFNLTSIFFAIFSASILAQSLYLFSGIFIGNLVCFCFFSIIFPFKQ